MGFLGFGEEEVDVLRHDNISADGYGIALAGLFEDLEEGFAGFGSPIWVIRIRGQGLLSCSASPLNGCGIDFSGSLAAFLR